MCYKQPVVFAVYRLICETASMIIYNATNESTKNIIITNDESMNIIHVNDESAKNTIMQRLN